MPKCSYNLKISFENNTGSLQKIFKNCAGFREIMLYCPLANFFILNYIDFKESEIVHFLKTTCVILQSVRDSYGLVEYG